MGDEKRKLEVLNIIQAIPAMKYLKYFLRKFIQVDII